MRRLGQPHTHRVQRHYCIFRANNSTDRKHGAPAQVPARAQPARWRRVRHVSCAHVCVRACVRACACMPAPAPSWCKRWGTRCATLLRMMTGNGASAHVATTNIGHLGRYTHRGSNGESRLTRQVGSRLQQGTPCMSLPVPADVLVGVDDACQDGKYHRQACQEHGHGNGCTHTREVS